MAIDSFFLYFNALKGEREYHLSVRKTTKTTREQQENNKNNNLDRGRKTDINLI